MEMINYHEKRHGLSSRARLPLLQEGKYADAPYFEFVDRSGVSLRRPNEIEYSQADRLIAAFPELNNTALKRLVEAAQSEPAGPEGFSNNMIAAMQNAHKVIEEVDTTS